MSEPYRADPEQDPELSKLAAQGYARRNEEDTVKREEERVAGAHHLNAALAEFLGASKSNAPLVGAGLGGLGILLAVLVGGYAQGLGVIGAFVAFISLFAWNLMLPKVSPEEMARERAWSASFPFILEGYFEVLSRPPSAARSLVYELRWRDGITPPSITVLEGVFAVADPGACVERIDEEGARVRSGVISGDTGTRVNRQPVYRNHKLPPHVHDVVEKALVPLAKSHPIVSVTING